MSRICIILAVFLVAVMFGLADMYLQGITQKVMQENGDWHYQITSIDTKTSDLIAARPEVEVSGWHSTISADAGYSISGQPIAISGLDEDVFGEIYLASLAEGKYPNAEKVNGVWEQRLRIHYNCVGTIEIPSALPLPTPDVSVNTRKGVVVNYAPCDVAI